MTIYFNDTIRNAVLNNLKTYIDGTCYIYGGTKPSDPDFPSATAALVSFNVLYGNAAANGMISLSNAPIAAEVANSGTATWFRLVDGTYKADGTVSATGGGGDAILDSVTLTAGEMVTLKQMDFSIPIPA